MVLKPARAASTTENHPPSRGELGGDGLELHHGGFPVKHRIIAIIIIPAYPLLAVIGLCHYIAMRFAPEPVWPEDMAAESSTAPDAAPA